MNKEEKIALTKGLSETSEIQEYFYLISEEEANDICSIYNRFKEKYPSHEKLDINEFEILFRTMDGEYICFTKDESNEIYLINDEYKTIKLDLNLNVNGKIDLMRTLELVKNKIINN